MDEADVTAAWAGVLGSVGPSALAGPGPYSRGVGYYNEDRVCLDGVDASRVRATVRGSVPYAVELFIDESNSLAWWCTCPAADDGSFCKHCVAVALQVMKSGDDPGQPDRPGGASKPHLALVAMSAASEHALVGASGEDRLAEYVASLPRERLEALVLDQVDGDWRLRERLLAEARAEAGEVVDLSVWFARIDGAFAPTWQGLVPYDELPSWAEGVADVIEGMVDLCGTGHADQVIELTEYAHRQAEQALHYTDDSDGYLDGIVDRLTELHLQACTEGAPDPIALAQRLAEMELAANDLGGFHQAAARYADLLGEAGLAAYRKVVEPRWALLADAGKAQRSEAYDVRQAMLGLAHAAGDPDELIAVHGQDLSLDAHLDIARSLDRAGREKEALDWARQGLQRHLTQPWHTPPLRQYLAGKLRQRGEEAEAVQLYWDAFDAGPSLRAYRELLSEAADGAGTFSERALGLLRARSEEAHRAGSPPARRPVGVRQNVADVLIEVLGYEGRIEEAWEAAGTYGCPDQMWLTLAREREAAHPLDAIQVYRREALRLIDVRKTSAYEAAVELMSRIRRLADDAAQPVLFDDLLAEVRTGHKAKRNLKALLDRKGW